MRILALAAALVLLGAGAVQAQTLDQNPLLNGLGVGSSGGQSTSSITSPSTTDQTQSSSQSQSQTRGNTPQSTAPRQTLSIPGAPMFTNAPTAVPPPGSANIVTGSGLTGNIVTSDGVQVPVFGTQLFAGSFAGTLPGDSPQYAIQSGDQISINLYGAVNNGGIQTVDTGGNVFIPGVGPVHLAGVSASRVQSVVAGAVHAVYTGAVGVYATIAHAGNIGVFVTGDVPRPGRFLGGVNDNVLYFLAQAGGVDPTRGSFRNVTVSRGGQVIATYDLYAFLLHGHTDDLRFKDGDVIFVGPRGPMIGVTGLVRNAFAFEAPSGDKTMTGQDLLPLARPEPVATSVSMHGFRNNAPQAAYYPLPDFTHIVLRDGDHVDFRSDAYAETVTVNILGHIKGPSAYVMPKGSKLSQLMAMIPLEGTNVDPHYVHVQRLEVALEQKRALQDALFNLQKQVLTATPSSSEAAALATAQATLVNQFVDRASQVQPDGNIAVYSTGNFQDLTLEDGDVVVLPDRTDVVIVTGEVLNPGGLTHASNLTIKGYVDRAGGYGAHANSKKFVLRHLDGSAEVATANSRPMPGDEIVVLPKVGNLTLQLIKDLTQIMFQVALTAASVQTVSGT